MVNVAVVTVEAVMVSLKVAVIAAFTATPVAALAGLVDDTVGGVLSVVVPVVNDSVKAAAIALPAASLAPVVIVARYVVFAAKLLDGVNVAVVPLYVTVPVTPLSNVKVVVDKVDAVMGSLKVAVIAEFSATLVALLAGLVEETVGAVVSAVEVVVPPPPPHAAKTMLNSMTKIIFIVFMTISPVGFYARKLSAGTS